MEDVVHFVIRFCLGVIFPVLVYAASAAGLYAAYTYGGWLLAIPAYGLCAWSILWMADWLMRASIVDLSNETLFERYIQPLVYAWPGAKGDAARLRTARDNLERAARYNPDQVDLPIRFGRYGEIEIYPRAVIASDNYDEYIHQYFGPKWHTWAYVIGLLLWPVTVPVAFVGVHAYVLYRNSTDSM